MHRRESTTSHLSDDLGDVVRNFGPMHSLSENSASEGAVGRGVCF
jgi:hypothetical protein